MMMKNHREATAKQRRKPRKRVRWGSCCQIYYRFHCKTTFSCNYEFVSLSLFMEFSLLIQAMILIHSHCLLLKNEMCLTWEPSEGKIKRKMPRKASFLKQKKKIKKDHWHLLCLICSITWLNGVKIGAKMTEPEMTNLCLCLFFFLISHSFLFSSWSSLQLLSMAFSFLSFSFPSHKTSRQTCLCWSLRQSLQTLNSLWRLLCSLF